MEKMSALGALLDVIQAQVAEEAFGAVADELRARATDLQHQMGEQAVSAPHAVAVRGVPNGPMDSRSSDTVPSAGPTTERMLVSRGRRPSGRLRSVDAGPLITEGLSHLARSGQRN